MIYLLALLPATALTIAGYFVLYLSTRSEGGLRTFGRYLGFWAFTLAGLVILGALFAAAHGRHGHCPMYCPMHGTHDGHSMMGGSMGEYDRCPFAEDSRPGPAAPAIPAAPADSGAPPPPPSPSR
jgi:hypothetical protein